MLKKKQNNNLVRAYLFSHWRKVFCAFLFSILLALCACLLSYLVGPSLSFMLQEKKEIYQIKNLVGENISYVFFLFFKIKQIKASSLLENLVFYLVIVSILKTFFTIFQSLLWELIGENIALDLRLKLFSSYVNSHPHFKETLEKNNFDKNIATLITTDVKVFRDYIVNVWGGLTRELIQVFFIGSSLFFLSPLLFISFTICLLPIALILKKIGTKLKKRSIEAIDNHSSLSEWLQERFLGLETIKARRTEAYEIEKMSALNKSLFEKYYRLAYTASRTSPLLEIVAVSALIIVIFVALKLIKEGFLTASIGLSFFTLLGILSQSINKLGRYFSKSKSASGSKKRILFYLEMFEKEKRNSHLDPLILTKKNKKNEIISCQNLSYSYQNKKSLGLKKFNYVFLEKKFYCITGPSGCGKSTLLKCLLNLLPYEKGKIRYTKELLPLNKIAYVSQKISLPPISLAKCISYPLEAYNEELLYEALEKSDLLEAVKKLKKGIHTVLNDEVNTGFSGGQNQRILLARLFYHRFPLILIDEGSSSLDFKTEEKICLNLRKQIEEFSTTVIFVSHSKEVMRYADEVIYIS